MTPLESQLDHLADELRVIVERRLRSADFGHRPWVLPKPRVLVMESSRSANVGGWHSAARWNQGAVKLDEIVLTPTSVSRGVLVAAEVLIHELVHLANSVAGRSDASRQGRYHNFLFRETAMAVGLKVSKDPKGDFGWCVTELGPELADSVRELNRKKVISLHVFKYRRVQATRADKSLVKLVCDCEMFVYVTLARAGATCIRCELCGARFRQDSGKLKATQSQ